MLLNIFCGGSISNLWKLRKCQVHLMFHQGAQVAFHGLDAFQNCKQKPERCKNVLHHNCGFVFKSCDIKPKNRKNFRVDVNVRNMKLLVCAMELFHTYIRQSRNIRQFNTSKTLSSYCYDRPWGKVLKVLNISASINVLSNAKCRFKMAFIIARNDVWDKVIFSRSMCQEFCPGAVSEHVLQVSRGGLKTHTQWGSWGVWPWGSPGPDQGGLQAQTQGGPGPHCGEGCVSQDALRQTPPWTATAAGMPHPTGMHSCFDKI